VSGFTQLSEHTFEIGGTGEVARVIAPAQPATAPIAVAARVADPSGPLSAAKMLQQMRARLREVKRQIAACKKLELERDQLQRLIRAANTELDNVRRIRAAG